MSLGGTQSPAPHEEMPANQLAPLAVPSPTRSPAPDLPACPPAPPQQRGGPEGGSARGVGAGGGGGGLIDPYTSFMDTIYTSFLQVSAKEQEEGAHSGPADPTSPFCALPPVSFPSALGEEASAHPPPPPLPQAGAPASLSPRRACSLRHPDLSRLSLEAAAAAHSPAQGAPKPSEAGASSPTCQRKTGARVAEGQTRHEPPLPPIYLEEAKTDSRPYGHPGPERQCGVTLGQAGGYLGPRDGAGGRPKEEGGVGAMLLHTDQGRVSMSLNSFVVIFIRRLGWGGGSCIRLPLHPLDSWCECSGVPSITSRGDPGIRILVFLSILYCFERADVILCVCVVLRYNVMLSLPK